MNRFSGYDLAKQALNGHTGWGASWRDPEPKANYEVVIVGGGGHGLATAYYLAKNHGITNVAVLERGYIGGGNTGRNTTIVRSDYMTEEANRFFAFSLKLWEGLSAELNFNQMLSQRGVVKLSHTQDELRSMRRRVNSARLIGSDLEMLTPNQIEQYIPGIDISSRPMFPIVGGMRQGRAGIARHDAVAWGYARAADARGVDIIQKCQVTGFVRKDGKIIGVETNRGRIFAKKVALTVAGNSSELVSMLGLKLPMETRPLQAWVSEPLKPFFHTVVTSATLMTYLSQSDKGELVIGGDLDSYNSFVQRGALRHVEDSVAGMLALFPRLRRVKMMRQWAGLVENTPDHSPLISLLPVSGMYINSGWGTGGFKATPGAGYIFADTIANNRPHKLAEPYSLSRFESVRLIPEHAASGGYSK
ncbi:sarcosine oxidase subunit beta family protein [Mesorhizobium captivum]|uniref:sarcosine oxidase subunit beta family protein n=2 Tax=Mesorhizobium TaxID=68287 RepID=UPI002A24B309|nr:MULTISPECIES: sarcosine oxidase subunit beta family protein [unclassified Mesorhizobium]MDX8449148.1 sarcosine oxidase subunit beta family protein [Mesorhizobium sp. VK3C]MDX8514639.1 sarcosine oxidase subunit beta family protein [Mesorhizobium sp. VK23E]